MSLDQVPQAKPAAGLIIYRKNGDKIEYLMLQTSYGIHHWTPPKGHVDPGESDLVTAIRETREEAGFEENDYEIKDKSYYIDSNYLVNNKNKRVRYWVAKLNDSVEVKLSEEHQAYKWLDLNAACEISNFDEFTRVLNQADSYIRNN